MVHFYFQRDLCMHTMMLTLLSPNLSLLFEAMSSLRIQGTFNIVLLKFPVVVWNSHFIDVCRKMSREQRKQSPNIQDALKTLHTNTLVQVLDLLLRRQRRRTNYLFYKKHKLHWCFFFPVKHDQFYSQWIIPLYSAKNVLFRLSFGICICLHKEGAANQMCL